MLKLKELKIIESKDELKAILDGKVLINTINAHSYNTAQKDELFAEALKNGDYLIPDGASIVMACRWLNAKSQPKERIAGWDLFVHEMNRINEECRMKNEELKKQCSATVGKADEECCDINRCNNNSSFNLHSSFKKKVMFLGSSEEVLAKIRQEASYIYHNIEVVTYSPPYKAEFSDEDNIAMVEAINNANPDLLWIGMTAPKQEKWVYEHWDELDIHCHVGTIGAVF
ncbi:MAG: WecB/TagA/CpsF family glycosyltransferase, partial [Prevotella sp.]|nr:WecB/TagA/CpsF family glycosyltransferase [Prevotella sp.]